MKSELEYGKDVGRGVIVRCCDVAMCAEGLGGARKVYRAYLKQKNENNE